MTGKTIGSMIAYFDGDVPRINHSLKVYGFAKSIAECEEVTMDELMIVELSAVLHDIGIKISEEKYNSSGAKYQEIEGPPIAESILNNLGIDANIIKRVCLLIANHHSYAKLSGIDFQILIEADFLVNAYEGNMKTDIIKKIKTKYFKTDKGIEILNSMFIKDI